MDKKRMALNVSSLILSFFCTAFVSFFVSPFVVKNLGAEAYGYVGLANNFIGYITVALVALTGMLSRFVTIEYSKGDYKTASGYFSTAYFTEIIIAVILLIPTIILCSKMDTIFKMSSGIVADVKTLWLLTFSSFLLGLSFGGFNSAMFAKNRLDIQAAFNIVKSVLNACILLITFLFFTPKVWYIGLAAIISNLVNITLTAIAKWKLTPEIKLSLKYFNKKYIYNLVVVGVWNSVNKLQQLLVTGLDLLLTNIFISGNEMGLLSIAKTLPGICSTLSGTVSSAFDPTMTITYGKGDKNQFIYQTKFAMKFTGFLCSIPVLGIAAFGLNFYELWQPSLTHDEIVKVQILACLTLLQELFAVYVYPLATVNTIACKLKVPALVSLGIGVANVVIVFTLLKTTNLGVYAVAGVSSVLWSLKLFTFTPLYAAHIIGEKKIIFYTPLIKGIINIVVVGSLMFTISHFFHANNWFQFVLICAITGAMGYVLCFFIQFDKNERKKVITLISNKIHAIKNRKGVENEQC